MGGIFSYLGNILAVMRQSYPPPSKFSPDQIPDLTGQVMIVTGSNTGIGKETAKRLLEHSAKVYIAARSKEKAEAAIADLKAQTGKEAIWLELDLSNFASIRKAAQEFLSKEPQLHVLFNNAGVMACPKDLLTAEGYDMQFGTNVLGHWLFTKLLLPALIAGKETSPDRHTRIIHTSSSGAYLYSLNFDSVVPGPARDKMHTWQLYFQSKFGNVVVSRQLAKRYADQGIISISLDPGNIKTDLQRYQTGIARTILVGMGRPVELGALTQLYAGTMPEAVNYNGKFLIPYAREGTPRKEALDDKLGERLWNWLEDQEKAH